MNLHLDIPWQYWDFSALLWIMSWVLPCIMLAIGLGVSLGRSQVKHKQQKVLTAILSILETTQKLETEVDAHNDDLLDVERRVEELDIIEEAGDIQKVLLNRISQVVQSNQKLQTELITARHAMDQQAQELDRTRKEALVDVLSGVANRKAFDDTLEYWLARAKKSRKTFALLLIDIDHFKWINDTHGHTRGDSVVSRVGEFLTDNTRSTDYVARYGGDEFVVLLNRVNQENAEKVAETLRIKAAEGNFDVGADGQRIAVTFSIGLALAEEDDDCTSLIEHADKALYRAKHMGRNCVRTWHAFGGAAQPV